MELLHLNAVSFRNLTPGKVTLFPGVNLFLGENGQGKTNFLETIYLLATLKSFREAKRREMTAWEKGEVQIEAAIRSQGVEKDLCLIWSAEGRNLQVNGHAVEDLVSYFRQVKTVCFCPEDMEIMVGSPAERRRFLDRLIFQCKPQHVFLVQEYNRVLKQRNSLLKQEKAGRGAAKAKELEVWTEQLITFAAKLTLGRLNFLNLFQERLPGVYARVAACAREEGILEGEVSLRWLSNLAETGITYEDLLLGYKEKSAQVFREERQRGVTLWGPHLDDFLPSYGMKGAPSFASMGQRKTFLLALRLSELELVREFFNEPPLLLLDDLSAELDAKRLAALVQLLAEECRASATPMQIFVTTVAGSFDLLRLLGEVHPFRVAGGKITSREVSPASAREEAPRALTR